MASKEKKSMANQRIIGRLFIRERVDHQDINRKGGMKLILKFELVVAAMSWWSESFLKNYTTFLCERLFSVLCILHLHQSDPHCICYSEFPNTVQLLQGFVCNICHCIYSHLMHYTQDDNNLLSISIHAEAKSYFVVFSVHAGAWFCWRSLFLENYQWLHCEYSSNQGFHD